MLFSTKDARNLMMSLGTGSFEQTQNSEEGYEPVMELPSKSVAPSTLGGTSVYHEEGIQKKIWGQSYEPSA